MVTGISSQSKSIPLPPAPSRAREATPPGSAAPGAANRTASSATGAAAGAPTHPTVAPGRVGLMTLGRMLLEEFLRQQILEKGAANRPSSADTAAVASPRHN